MLKQFFIAAILVGALGIAVGNIAQQALAVKGGLGQYFSKAGRDTYYGGESGKDFGNQVQTYARPGNHQGGHESFGVKNLGDNFAYYASGKCHTQPCE